MLLVLSFLACFSGAQSSRCQQVEVVWEGSMLQCQLFGQQAAAQWMRDHSGYRLRGGYACVPGRAI